LVTPFGFAVVKKGVSCCRSQPPAGSMGGAI
jgi:hypothetical protein